MASVTAYDLCKNLDIPFDCGGYEQFDEKGKALWYPTTQIVSDIAHQCGFGSGGYSGRISQLCYNDISRSCRQILEDLSHNDVGRWQDSGGILAFVPFSPDGSGLDLPDENGRSEVVLRGEKIITGIYAADEIYGTEYSTG